MTDHRDEHETYGHTESPVIEDLRKQIASLLDEQTGFRVAIAQLTAERDEARDEVSLLRSTVTDLNIEIEQLRMERDEARRLYCEVAAMDESGYVKPIDMRHYAESRGWDCFKEDGK